jgi:NADH-quinone oxidoreductase subunit N
MIAAAAAISTPSVQLGAILPAFLLTLGALLLLLVGSFETKVARVSSGVIGLATFTGAGLATWHLWNNGNGTAFSGQLATDRYSALVQAIVCACGVVSILLGWGTRRLGDRIAEYYSLLCFAGAGMCLLASANGFVSLFIALELFSIALYALCALDIHDAASLESGLKYLVTGSVGSAALLFGSGLVYIATGSLRFDLIGEKMTAETAHTGILLLGIAMIVAGLAFKASAAPFHMWTPDVYEGAPTAVMAFMATATKTIALAVLLRVMITSFPMSSDIWEGAVAAVAIASMLIGNIAALRQANVKRMLAYSGVGQAGYLLIAVVVHTPLATRALLYYLAVYAAMNLGALAVVSVREREIGGPVSLEDLKGLGRDHPLLAGGLALSLLSLASFPPTGGFLAKVYLFGSAIDAGMSYLAVIGVIGTMISLAYYLRFLMAIYTPPGTVKPRPRIVPGTRLAATAVLASAAIVLWLGIAPAPFIDVARTAAASLVPHA